MNRILKDLNYKINGPRLSVLISFLVIGSIYFFLATYGTWDIFGKEKSFEPYDSLGRSLLHGRANVQGAGWEGFHIKDNVYMYFGPFPALLRIILNAVFPGLYGCWSRISCFIAAILALIAFWFILNLQLKENQFVSPKYLNYFRFLFLFTFALGSLLFFLISCSYIYHEAILWGFCGSLWAMFFAFSALNRPWPIVKNSSAMLSFAAGVALLARLTFSVPFYLVITCLGIFIPLKYLYRAPQATIAGEEVVSKIDFSPRKIVIFLIYLIGPAALFFIFQLWYNYLRFGSPFVFIDYEFYYPHLVQPSELSRLKAMGAFNILRISEGLKNLFFVDSRYFLQKFPFVTPTPAPRYDQALYLGHEWTIPLTIVSPWLLYLAQKGLFHIAHAWPKDRKILFLSFAFLSQWLIVLGHFSLTHRYVTDLLPLFLLLAFVGVKYLGKGWSRRSFKVGEIGIVSVLCVVSIVTTVLSTLAWTHGWNWGAPDEYRILVGEFFLSVNRFLGIP